MNCSPETQFRDALHGRLNQIASSGQISNSNRSVRMVMSGVKQRSYRTPLSMELGNGKSTSSPRQPTVGKTACIDLSLLIVII